MATLSGNKIKDTYTSLLKLDSNGVTSTVKAIEDGAGTTSALALSTNEVQVEKLSFSTTPVTDSNELTALFVDGNNEVVKRELDASAFAPASVTFANPMFILRPEDNFAIETSLSTPTQQGVNNNSNSSSHEVNDSTNHLTTSSTTIGAVVVQKEGLVKIDVNMMINIPSGNSNIEVAIYEKASGGSAVLIQSIVRAHSSGANTGIGFSLVRNVAANTDLFYEISSSASATLKNTSTFILTKLD